MCVALWIVSLMLLHYDFFSAVLWQNAFFHKFEELLCDIVPFLGFFSSLWRGKGSLSFSCKKLSMILTLILYCCCSKLSTGQLCGIVFFPLFELFFLSRCVFSERISSSIHLDKLHMISCSYPHVIFTQKNIYYLWFCLISS